MFNIARFLGILSKHSDNKLLCFILVVLMILITWVCIHIEMWLYEEIIIKAMGANLNPLSFWEMVGFDILCGMLTSSSSSNKED